jgi:hypothetical protein
LTDSQQSGSVCVRACWRLAGAPTDRVANAAVNSDAALNTAINQLWAQHAALGKLSNLQFTHLQYIIIYFNPPTAGCASGSTPNSCGLSPCHSSQTLNFQAVDRVCRLVAQICAQNFQFHQTRKSSFTFLRITSNGIRSRDKTNFPR